MRIAVLDDDDTQLTHLVHTLNTQWVGGDETLTCVPFQQGEALRRALRRETFDALVLDWNVPDLDGVDLLHWLRHFQKSQTPVLMLSSRACEKDVASALGLGADDYIIKPYRPLELCARIRRLIARQQLGMASDSVDFGSWSFDRATLSVSFAGDSTALQTTPLRHTLTDREFRLALALFRNMGKVTSRAYLLESAGYNCEELPSRTLDSHIYRLRTKLGLTMQRGMLLQTVYGQGYRLESHQVEAHGPLSPMGGTQESGN